MRKRSKYRPKGVILNPIAYVMESMTPVAKHESYLIDLKIRNHAAMTALTRGMATKTDMDDLIAMANISEALSRLGFGQEYADVTRAGLDSLHEVGKRGMADPTKPKFILRSSDMKALNELMELHDAQMDVITIKDMERAIDIVNEEFRQRKMRPILERNK